ncbi:MAG: sodium/proton-translocating pyrophosphatase [Acidimicrobiales bacterium]|nr:sodium/proton-translocating pyrophosphatase [Acidimicrobiales bacterium]
MKEIAESARTGPATTVLSGTSIGLESTVWAIIAIAVAIGAAIGLGGGNIQLSSTWWPSPAWACSAPPAWSCPRTPSGPWPTTRPASPRCRATSRASPSASW